MYNPALSRYMQ